MNFVLFCQFNLNSIITPFFVFLKMLNIMLEKHEKIYEVYKQREQSSDNFCKDLETLI